MLPQVALADTVPVGEYARRLEQARAELVRARAGGSGQAAALSNARALLTRTDALTLATGDRLPIDDAALAGPSDGRAADIDAAIARVDARLILVRRSGAPSIDAAAADARLREIVRQSAVDAPPVDLLDAIGRAILRFFSQLRGPGIDTSVVWPAVGLLGVAVILFVLATLGRALPERVRREVLVNARALEARVDPAAQLRAADAALAAGRPRDALHAFYLYVIAALSAREAIRYDPALTDRELLDRAAAIPHADSLRDLVLLYERSWFGLREPSQDEARRARDLALRVAP